LLRDYIFGWTTPLARVVVGFVFGVLLAVLGGLLAAFFNVLTEFPWELAVHKNIVLVGIGLGAGAGAYLAWMSPSFNPLLRLGVLLLVLLGSNAGAYIGHFYGPGVDPDDFRELFAIDSTIHLAAAAGGIIVSTTVGLLSQVRRPDRLKSRILNMPLKFRD